MFFKKPYDVVFYYPQHFNRSIDGTNAFFDPLIAICEKNNLKYLVLEEPDNKTTFPRNKKAKKFDFWLYFILVMRKILPLYFFKNSSEREYFIGSIIGHSSFNKYKANNYITISNSLIDLLPGLQKEANVYDLQHGIIYSWHWGYFDENGNLNDFLKHHHIRILVYGKGYQGVFFKNNPELKETWPKKVAVVGSKEANAKSASFDELKTRKKIVYTLDITSDKPFDVLKEEKNSLDKLLSEFQELFIYNDFKLVLKKHPRYNNCINLDDLFEKYSFIERTNKSLVELIPEVFLHLTQASTSTFEMGLAGIPTAFIPNDLGRKVFIDEYQYPLEDNDLESLIKMFVDHPILFDDYAKRVSEWAKFFYQPINEKKFVKLMTKNDSGVEFDVLN